jgi:hypothetical protein
MIETGYFQPASAAARHRRYILSRRPAHRMRAHLSIPLHHVFFFSDRPTNDVHFCCNVLVGGLGQVSPSAPLRCLSFERA